VRQKVPTPPLDENWSRLSEVCILSAPTFQAKLANASILWQIGYVFSSLFFRICLLFMEQVQFEWLTHVCWLFLCRTMWHATRPQIADHVGLYTIQYTTPPPPPHKSENSACELGIDKCRKWRRNVWSQKCLWPVCFFFFCAGVALCVFHPPEALICQMSVSHEQNSHIYAEFKGGPNLFGTRHGRLDDARKKYLKKRRRFWHASIWNASSPFWPPRLSACNLHFFPL